MERQTEDKYSDEVLSLKEALDREKLPLVLRTHNDYCHSYEEHTVRVPKGTLLYIEGKTKIQAARISVLEHARDDEENMTQLHGDDFIYERGNFVDREYLVPLKYPCKLKFIHRPSRRLRYASIQQVLGDMPHLLKVNVAAMDSPPHPKPSKSVPANSILQLRSQFVHPADDKIYITFTCGGETYTFCEDAVVNMTAVLDTRVYTLYELAAHQYFPAVFHFESIALEDIVHYADDLSSDATLMAQGPLELLGTDHVIAAVAWARDEEFRTYKTLLLLQDTWTQIHVQQRRFEDTDAKASFIRRSFSQCPDSGFVERSLYCVPPDKNVNVWLKSPELFSVISTGHTFKCRKNIDFHDSSDIEEGGETESVDVSDDDRYYEQMAPQLPRRIPIDHSKEIEEAIAEKKSVFGKVHVELMDWVQKKLSVITTLAQQTPPPRPPRPVRPPKPSTVQRSTSDVSSLSGIFRRKPMPEPPLLTTNREHMPAYRRCVSESVRRAPTNTPDDGDSDYETYEIEYPYIPRKQQIQNTKTKSTEQTPVNRHAVSDLAIKKKCNNENINGDDDEYDTPYGVETSKQSARAPCKLPFNSAASSRLVVVDGDGVYYTSEQLSRTSTPLHQPKEKKDKPYVDVESREGRDLMKQNQGPEDFYKLTVSQVSALFKLCNLGTLADVCFKQRLDGSFFRDFDLKELLNEPFKANKFQLLKIGQMIEKGWRPNVN